jgi:hypothetical protein
MRPSITMPPPTPVPRITPNTQRAPRPAPSIASDSAKQLASLAMRISRPSTLDFALSGWPLRQPSWHPSRGHDERAERRERRRCARAIEVLLSAPTIPTIAAIVAS